jgi:hypothetical protein
MSGAIMRLEAAYRRWYVSGMAINLTHPSPSAIDVSGLSPDDVRAVESFVTHLRSPGPRPAAPRLVTDPPPTDEEFERALRELAAGPPVMTLPADWSRADLYDDHD